MATEAINYVELRNYANRMKELVSSIKTSLEACNQGVISSVDDFTGYSADTYRNRYFELTKDYPKFLEKMEEYIAFLNYTAKLYEEADKLIQEKTSELSD